MKTVQLRRYTLVDGESEAFVAWWTAVIPALRAAAGFTLEFAYLDAESGEFIWAVSVPGDAADFTRVDEAYQASDTRRAAFAGLTERVAHARVSLVETIY